MAQVDDLKIHLIDCKFFLGWTHYYPPHHPKLGTGHDSDIRHCGKRQLHACADDYVPAPKG